MYQHTLNTVKRKILGYSQEIVAEMLDVTRPTIVTYEHESGSEKKKKPIDIAYNTMMDAALQLADPEEYKETIEQFEHILKLLKEPI